MVIVLQTLGVVAALLFLLLLLGYFGLPERRLPPPPPPRKSELLRGAEPWRFEGKSGVAFLICHGYGGSPFNTRPLGEFLHSLGHTSIGILLPGHGTRIEDMARSRYYHWYDYLEQAYRDERNRYRRIILIGFSLGGTLALDVAARNADIFRPNGLVTISSPVFFNGFFNGRVVLHQPTAIMTGVVKIFRKVIPLKRSRGQSDGVRRSNPWVGYRGYLAVVALHSFKRAFWPLRRRLHRIAVPYCSVMAANDHTVSAQNQTYIYNKIQSREKRALMMILPPDESTMHSLLTHRFAQERVFRFIQEFVEDTLREKRPLSERYPTAGERLERSLFSLFRRRRPENLSE